MHMADVNSIQFLGTKHRSSLCVCVGSMAQQISDKTLRTPQHRAIKNTQVKQE